MENFLCAGFAAATAICVMNPVDVVKTRLQFQGELGHRPKVYAGILSSLLHIRRIEGVEGLYRGLGAAVLLQFSVTATRFATYFLVKDYLGYDNTTSSFRVNLGLSLVSAAAGGLCGTPFFALKTQLQARSSCGGLAVGHQHSHADEGVARALRTVYNQQGLRGYFRGVESFVPRVMAYGSVSLATYDTLKPLLVAGQWLPDGPAVHIVASVVAAGLGVGAMQPFDLIAARLMNQPTDGPVGLRYSGPIDCARQVLRTEGPAGLLKGCAANYARMGPYTVLTFLCFEHYKGLAGRWRAGTLFVPHPPAAPPR